MSDRIFLALIGVAFGTATFAAIGVAASLVMSEVRERTAQGAYQLTATTAVYAQMQGNGPVTR